MKRLLGGISIVLFSLGTAAAETISILGSDTLLILNQEWARAYMEKNPGIRVEVTGGGSGRGIKALLADQVDIAASSRAMSDAEIEDFIAMTGERPWEVRVAMDGIGVYVHSSNPLTQLSVERLAEIFTGKITNWKELSGLDRTIVVYNRDVESGTREFISEYLLKGEPFALTSREVSTTGLMTSMVSRDRGGIGYGGIAYSPGTNLVKLIPDGAEQSVAPSAEAVRYGEYPLGRPLQFYLNRSTVSPRILAFVRWVLGREGQEIVRKVGYYPILPRDPSAEPAGGGVVITPENMSEHNLKVAVRFGADREGDPLAEDGEKIAIAVSFHPDGTAIREASSLGLRLGDDLKVPLMPERDPVSGLISEVRFIVRVPLISDVHLELQVPGSGVDPQNFLIPIRHWNRIE